MNFKTKIYQVRGHSLVEMVTAVGVIAAVAGICLLMVGRIKENSDVGKLEGDMASLNRAAKVYLANGGAFEATTDVDAMLAKLKTYPLSTQRHSIVGLRGPMVDMRVKAVPMTSEEESTSRPRAVWNSDMSQLALVTSGPGIKEFILGTVPPIIEEVRQSTVEYASVSDWVWDYDTDGSFDRPGYGGDVTTSDETQDTAHGGGGGGGVLMSGTYAQDLAPPIFSLPGGFYEYFNFPLAVTLENPNPEGSSQIWYSMGGGSLELYTGGQIIVPGDYSTIVMAYCESADLDFWNNSLQEDEIYETLYISGSSDGTFESPDGDENLVYTIEETDDGSIFSWGTPAEGYTRPSSLHFEGTSFENISPEQEFEIGSLTFYNGTIVSGTGANGVELELDLDLTVNIPIATQEITFTFELINTPNYEYQSNDDNADYVVIAAPREEFTTTFNGVTYYIDLSFGEIGENGFSTIDQFHVWENEEATGAVIARITTVEPEEWDFTPPTVVLSTPDDLVNGQFEVTGIFSEVVNGFELSDIQVVNGEQSSLTSNIIAHTFFVTPNDDGLVTIRIPAGAVVDGNGNPNTESNLLEVIADLTAPHASLAYTQPQSDYKNNNGHGNNVDGVDSSNPSNDPIYLGIDGGHFDLDTSSSISSVGGGSTDGHVHEYDDKYDVNGADFFSLRDSKLSNINEVITDGNQKFIITIANGDLNVGGILAINGGNTSVTSYDDASPTNLPVFSLNGGVGTTQLSSLGIYFAENVIQAGGLVPTNTGDVRANVPGKNGEWRNGALTIQALAVNNDGSPAYSTDLSMSNGGLHGVASSGLLWEATIFWHWDGDSYHEDGNTFVPGQLQAGTGIGEVSGDPENGGGGPNGQVDPSGAYDDEIKGVEGDPYRIAEPITVDITYDEPVVGLSYDDFVVSGASLSDLDGSGSEYTVLVTPAAHTDMVTLQLASGAVADGVGNASDESATIYMMIDSANPTITLATASSSVEGSFSVDVVVDESAYGFDITDVIATNGMVSDFSAEGNQMNFSFRVTPQSAGRVSISVPTAAFSDDALNTNLASNILNVVYTATSYIDFSEHGIAAYGGWQDQGKSKIKDDGATLEISDNAWKSIDYAVTVSPNTILEFEFSSDKVGEVHGIGLDTDSQLSASHAFKVYGSQDWGKSDFYDYRKSDKWKAYSIPIGQFYTGDFTKMVFIADDDKKGKGKSKFRNVRVFTP